MGFLGVILPIFSIFVLGFIGQKKFRFDTKAISTMALYLMSPVLVFRTFYSTEFDASYGYLALYTFGLCFALITLVYAIAFIRNYSVRETCAMILASSFMNNGNYGTPVVFLLFGAAGLDYAIILMVIQQIVMCTVGIYYAAKGSPEGNGVQSALQAVRRMPIVYGGIIGGLFHYFNITLSSSFLTAVNLVADAAIPTIMLTLGMQLANISIKKLAYRKLSLSLTLKLVISPLIASVLALILPVEDLVKQIMIIMAAMPTAANTTLYAMQFDTDPEFVSSATFFSTILSLLTLPILLTIII